MAMEYSSSSALLYLSHRLLHMYIFMTMYILYNKPEPRIKQGLCSFYIMCVLTRVSTDKAEF